MFPLWKQKPEYVFRLTFFDRRSEGRKEVGKMGVKVTGTEGNQYSDSGS
jgi:hypothetical protein